MATIRARVAPWLPSRKTTLEPVRPLTLGDTDALRLLVARDRISNVFIDSLLDQGCTATPGHYGALILGYFAPDNQLEAACWVGSNIVPVEAAPEHGAAFGLWIGRHWRPYASIFGHAPAVLAILEQLVQHGIRPHEVRESQPLLAMTGISTVAPNPELRSSSISDFDSVLLAAATMFEEEVGYSPFLGGAENYRRRVAWLINSGHSFSQLDNAGQVIFKADLGAVTRYATQVQGVWLNPDYRGSGLSAAYMAAVVALSQKFAPITSLYVNDYNVKARSLYGRVGFEQIGTFATVLL